jgi:hypothetical protein
LTVIFPYPRPVTRVPAPPEIEALFEQMQTLHVRFGRTLHTVRVGPMRKKSETPAVDTFTVEVSKVR